MNKQPRSIFLTGFRATGKTTVGQLLADRLRWTFLDTDELLCRKLGAPIADVVARHGWGYFRQAEGQLLHELALARETVVATGGGAIEHHNEWRELRQHGFVVWLDADIATIRQRLQDDPHSGHQRPSLTGQPIQDEIAELLERRRPFYASGSDLRLTVAGKTPAMLVEEIARAMSAIQCER